MDYENTDYLTYFSIKKNIYPSFIILLSDSDGVKYIYIYIYIYI